MSDNLKDKTKTGLIWSAIERFSVQGVQFFVMLFMARLLTPHDYGIIGMLAVFLAISNVFIDSGFSQALIRKTDRTETDNSTVFYFNVVVGVLMYALCFIGAPYVADFYQLPELCAVMRVVSITLFINSLVVVQRALFTASIDFKTQAKATFLAVILSGATGVCLAYKGYGVWALVWQQLVSASVNAIMLWAMANWMPKLTYSWQSFRELFSFGSKLLASSLIDTTYNNIKPLLIGKYFSAAELGHYIRADQFSNLPSSNVTSIIQRVTFPVLVQLKDDDERLERNYRKFIKLSALLIFPIMMGVAAVSPSLVKLTIGEQWDFCAELLQIICFYMMWYPVHAINLSLLQVKGRSDLFLRLEIIKKVVGLSVIAISIPFGVKAMCYGSIVSCFISLFINTYYTGKLINVGFFVQMKDLFSIFASSLVMFAAVLVFNMFVTETLYQFAGGVIIGSLVFLSLATLFCSQELSDMISFIKKKN